ncbi:metallophosphoesterase [Gottschalkia purinilytica]|uniref:Metallophosphoesterase n=1 Tax=Gottschalkia purinilytica TaxID=1503 RepID=A0A0L0W9B2_GOTPU|nr:DNA repair exonuclease [Gottschalkia purinilytica]KNF08143.1 metallophosphoesterase [Gottschalkia purinilytica]
MHKIKCIHTGDLHLGLKFKNINFDSEFAHKRRLEIWETFSNIIERCKETSSDLLLISGDLFEDKYCTVNDIRKIESKFKEIANTKVVIIAGNHDPLNSKSIYNLGNWSENVYIIREDKVCKIEFDDINTVIWGLSWSKKEEKNQLLDEVSIEDSNKINILLAHGDIFNKNSEYLPIDKEKLIRSGFNYVALGHIHKHQFITDKIAYCGSPEPLDFGEIGEHGIIEGEISLDHTNMNFRSISKRKLIVKDIVIDECMNYDDIIQSIIECVSDENKKNSICKITVKGIRDKDVKIDDYIKDNIKKYFDYIEIIDETNPNYDIEEIYKKNADNIIGFFIKEIEKEGLDDEINKEALYYGLDVLLSEKVKL